MLEHADNARIISFKSHLMADLGKITVSIINASLETVLNSLKKFDFPLASALYTLKINARKRLVHPAVAMNAISS
jgi:hypothetical protein